MSYKFTAGEVPKMKASDLEKAKKTAMEVMEYHTRGGLIIPSNMVEALQKLTGKRSISIAPSQAAAAAAGAQQSGHRAVNSDAADATNASGRARNDDGSGGSKTVPLIAAESEDVEMELETESSGQGITLPPQDKEEMKKGTHIDISKVG